MKTRTASILSCILLVNCVLLAILPQFSMAAGDRCSDIFMSDQMRAHEAKYTQFVDPGPMEGRLGNTAAKAHMLNRLRAILPAGRHDVSFGFMQRGILDVSYDKLGNVTIQLGPRIIQSGGRALQRGFEPASNVSFGIDGRVQLLADNRLAVSSMTIRGNEKTLAGLDRSDRSIVFDLSKGPSQTIFLTETNTNWSTYRAQNLTTTTETRIEPRN
ncbi:hypothetical protein BH10BDE1_BH10BDE1_01900 [soil metagenome]